MSAPVQPAPLQTFRLRTLDLATPAVLAGIGLHFALAAWLGDAQASTTPGRLVVWGLPVLLGLCGIVASGEMSRRRGGRLMVDRAHHQLVQRHHGLPEPVGTWEWSEIKAVRVRRRLASDLVEIDLGSERLCACTQRCQGADLVSCLRDAGTGDPAGASHLAASSGPG